MNLKFLMTRLKQIKFNTRSNQLKPVKISALSSGEFEKYEYLTGEDLGYKPRVLEQAKFEYSSLGKVFNKGLDESDNDMEDENEEKFKVIENLNKNELMAIEYGEDKLELIGEDNKIKILCT